MLNGEDIPEAGFVLFGWCNSISLFPKNGFINIEGKNSLSAGIAKLYSMSWGQSSGFMAELNILLWESNFGSGIECEIIAFIFLIEILFKIVVIELALFIPIAYLSFSGESICDVIVLHRLLSYIFVMKIIRPY